MSPSKKILFMMSGSIAAFKACGLLSKLKQQGHDVQVVASRSALQFVGEATLEGLSGRKVLSDLWESGQAMDHIHAVRWADLLLVAPASAHYINRIAEGVGDDLLTTLFLAHDFKKPFLVAPAMNTSMYLHPATQKSLATLRSWGIEILEAASGVLACGEQGYGRLLEVDQLLREVNLRLQALSPPSSSVQLETSRPGGARSVGSKIRVLITAGGTIEPIDEVRFIGNESSGRTGFKIAEALRELGAEVTLLASSSARQRFAGALSDLNFKSFQTFSDLAKLLETELRENTYTHLIHTAAVSDYSVKAIYEEGEILHDRKIPSGKSLTLELEPNPKLIDQVKDWSQNTSLCLIGFKLTRGADPAHVGAKVQELFQHSQAKYVVHNDQSRLDHGRGLHPFQIFDARMGQWAQGESSQELVQAISRLVFQEVV